MDTEDNYMIMNNSQSNTENVNSSDAYEFYRNKLENNPWIYTEILKNISEGILIHKKNLGIVFANPFALNILGKDNNEIYGRNINDFIEPEFRDSLMKNLSQPAGQSADFELIHTQGRKTPVRVRNNRVDFMDDILQMLSLSNITEQRELKNSLHESGKKFRTLIEHCSEVIAVIDINGIFDYCSDSIKRIFGYSSYEIAGNSLFDYVHPEDIQNLKNAFNAKILNNIGKEVYVFEFRFLAKEKFWKSVKAYINNMLDNDLINGILINIKDVTEQKMAEKLADHFQMYDSLVTNLPNLGLLKNRLDAEITKVKGRNTDAIIAVMTLGIDKFQNINNRYGTVFGDILLDNIGKRLMESFRDDDLVARYSGDIFIILLSYIAKAYHFKDIIQKTKKIFSEPFVINENIIHVTISLGLSIYPNDGDDVDFLVSYSNVAMHKAKLTGSGSCCLYDPAMQEEMISNLELEEELKSAINNDEFILHYQPKYDCDMRLAGAESLVRWNSLSRGLVYPGLFIHLLEKSGMIIDVGYSIMEKACRQCREWEAKGFGIKISINISPVQFTEERFIENIRKIIERTSVNVALLEFEITESGIIQNAGIMMEKLHKIKDMGIDISMDDFGTGLSSLSNLIAYPINILKIDKSFIDKIPDNSDGRVVVDLIIGLASKLGLTVVAEGIENERQHAYLKENNCNLYQGYYYCRPVAIEEFEKRMPRI